jgi:hypothetical protein
LKKNKAYKAKGSKCEFKPEVMMMTRLQTYLQCAREEERMYIWSISEDGDEEEDGG